MDRIEPMLPIDRTEFFEPTDRIEPSDRMEHHEPFAPMRT